MATSRCPQPRSYRANATIKIELQNPAGSQALAVAGCVDPELNSSDITIFRPQEPGEIQTIALNLSDVMSGNIADPQIQPDDVIVVPMSTPKFIVKRFVGMLVGGMSIGQYMK